MPNQQIHINSLQNSIPSLGTTSDTLHTTSLFQGHLLVPKTDKPLLHFTDYDYGVVSILLLAYILFVWLFASNKKRLSQVVKSFYINRHSNQLGRDELSLGNRVSIFLSILFVISSSLFIIQIADYYKFVFNVNKSVLFLEIATVISLIYAVKMVIIRFFGYIFQNKKEASEYSMMIFLFCNTLGLFMLPIVVSLAFVEGVSPLIFIYFGFGVSAFLLCIRLLRGIIIGFNSNRVSKFYLFLYLCTLEILPFVIMVKLFMQNIK